MRKLFYLLPAIALLLFWPSLRAQTQHSDVLTWTASTTTGVNYVVWRGTTTGGPYTIQTTTPIPALTYTDTTGVGGTKYFYVVQSTCTGGTCPTGISGTSAFSNEVALTFLGSPAPPTALQGASN